MTLLESLFRLFAWSIGLTVVFCVLRHTYLFCFEKKGIENSYRRRCANWIERYLKKLIFGNR